jgi:acyl-coenzyme A thioesterase PaaI-like protein
VVATIAVAESRIEQDARLVAKGTFTFLQRAR